MEPQGVRLLPWIPGKLAIHCHPIKHHGVTNASVFPGDTRFWLVEPTTALEIDVVFEAYNAIAKAIRTQ